MGQLKEQMCSWGNPAQTKHQSQLPGFCCCGDPVPAQLLPSAVSCAACSRIHISVQIPHQDGMLPLISTLPLHNLHFLLSESIYRHQHVCSNLVTVRDLRGISGSLQCQPLLPEHGSLENAERAALSSSGLS